jgi:hypothetical protein
MKPWRMICLVGAVLTVAGCSGKQVPTAQQCGRETYGHGEGYNAGARACLWQAVLDEKPSEFTSIVYTIEGDPITSTILARAPTQGAQPRFTVQVVNKDKHGKQGTFKYLCTSMERVERIDGAAQRFSFRLKGCSGRGDANDLAI